MATEPEGNSTAFERLADALADARESRRSLYPLADERDVRELDRAEYLLYLFVNGVPCLHRLTSVDRRCFDEVI